MIGYLDCSTGVSGDKFLGALLDVGWESGAFTPEHLGQLLARIAPEARVVAERVRSRGIAAVSVRVEAAQQPPHRAWRDIRSLIAGAQLTQFVRARSLSAFGLLAEAEARAHGVAIDDVHFHEVGALDSILDMIGVPAGLEAFGIDVLTCSAVATGWGTVQGSHGVLPVPAPATAFLLEGVPTVPGPRGATDAAGPGELTTPTGAALVRACVAAYGPSDPMTPRAHGYGAGTRDIGHPNVCRLTIGEPGSPSQDLMAETVTLLETNIDHISPEAAALAAEQLLAEGALDVWTAPITMKKGRAAFTMSALVETDAAEPLAARIVALTGTLGVRRREIERLVARRAHAVVQTPYGPVRVKMGADRARVEADDIARIARENGVSFDAAQAEIGAFLALERTDD